MYVILKKKIKPIFKICILTCTVYCDVALPKEHLLNTHHVPDTVLGDRDVSKTEFPPQRTPGSKRGRRTDWTYRVPTSDTISEGSGD